jgi:MoaA/NifB/PqqE/SkfB family radical SAM enzyme
MNDVRLLNIESTTRCNFTCDFCVGRKLRQADLAIEILDRALTAFPEVEHLDATGEGEPLLHPRFFEILSIARTKGLRTHFYSNGSLFTDSTIDKILDAAVETIFISIESADPIEYSRLRGGSLRTLVAGISRLISARDARHLTRPSVGFSVTVLRTTQHQLKAIVELYIQLRMDGGMVMQSLNRMPGYSRYYNGTLQHEMLSANEEQELIQMAKADANIGPLLVPGGGRGGFAEELVSGYDPIRTGCPWLERAAFVNQDGYVMPCCMVKDTTRSAFGLLGRESLEEITGAREALRRELNTGRIPNCCVGCDIADEVAQANIVASTEIFERELSEVRRNNAVIAANIENVRARALELHASWSWKVSAPLRWCYKQILQFRGQP